jgi:hypothetical protein
VIARLLDWLLYRHRRTMTGIFDGRSHIHPHLIHPPIVVGARVARRLRPADRVEFVAVERSDGPSEAHRVRVYRRP